MFVTSVTDYRRIWFKTLDRPQTTPEPLDWGRGAMKLKEPQVVVSELFIYTLVGCSCFTMHVNDQYNR